MQNNSEQEQSPRGRTGPNMRWPRWIGYPITVLIEIGLTLGLAALMPSFPLARFPIPYVLAIMVVAYLFGEGPATLAFFLGLAAFTYSFLYPANFHWPVQLSPQGWAQLTAFFIGTLVVGLATLAMRRSKHRVQELAQELHRDYQRASHIADTLQTSMLAEVPSRMNCFEFETLYRAALDEARVGGDFYDVFQMDEDRVAVVIGDVSGKGLKAAIMVAMARACVRSHAYECQSLPLVLEQVNNTIVRDTSSEDFITIFAGILDCKAMTLTYANGGHQPAILWRASEGNASSLENTGPLIGALKGARYEERTIPLSQGDELLLATDGLYEIQCGSTFMSLEGLIDIYSELKRTGVVSVNELLERVASTCGSVYRDDVAVLRVLVTT
ncbi:MAG: SpoIIE family protein phosphatase [Armatimonadetes bacterium]|nr:SpoIIE family protein phosphatase [Armatimonadota bacterium]